MIAALLWLSLALAGDDALRAEVQRQEAVVDALAAEVAAAQTSGASRQEIARRMALYRAAAETLAKLEAPLLQTEADAERLERAEAARRLTEALAQDGSEAAGRATLVGWLGEPAARAPVLESVTASAATAEPALRRALALDLSEQAGGLALVARYDAAQAERTARRASARASALRARTGPGKPGGLDLVIDAERAEREAALALAEAAGHRATLLRLEAVRGAALALLEDSP